MTKARSNAVAEATKGDLSVGTGTNLAGILAVGTNGDTLVADSSTSTGLRYQGNYAAGKNAIINGDFNIFQRGISTTIGVGAYWADRFAMDMVAAVPTGTASRQTFTPGAAPVAGYEGNYFGRINITAHNNCTAMYIYQRIENVTTFANQSVSISVYIKADAAVSMSARLVQNFGSGGSGAVVTTLTGSPASVTTGWVRHTFTATVPSISGKTIGTGSSLEIRFDIPKDGSFVRNGTYDFWGVQVEAGSVATAFQTATGTIQGELSAAQRYYYRISATNSPLSICEMRTTTTAGIVVPMAVTMRTSPTLDASSGTNYFIAKVANTNHNISGAWTLDIASPTASELFATTGTTATAGNAGFVYLNNASAYLGFSAEL